MRGEIVVDSPALNKKFQKELNAGIASLVLLSVLDKSKKPMYGYQIARLLEDYSGKLDDDGFDYDDGSGEEIVVVRAFYEWPTVTQFLGEGFTKLANGNHLGLRQSMPGAW